MTENIKRLIIYAVLFFSIVLALTSCSASWHIRKAIKKDPTLFDTVTVVRTDTIIIKDIQKDTIVQWRLNVRDSIIFKDKTKVVYRILTDSIEIDVDCPDQIIVKDSVFVNSTVTTKETFVNKVKSLWWLFPLGIMLGVLWGFWRR